MSLLPLEKAASGALALVIANTLVYPLDLSKTIIQTQVKKPTEDDPDSLDSVFVQRVQHKELKYKNTLDVLAKIYAKKGVLGWYHGLFLLVIGTAAQNFSYFYWYTIVKRVYARLAKTASNAKHSTPVELFLGALAAAISQLFTMPIGVITTQQQTDKQQRLLYRLAREIYEHDGVLGYWKGLRVSLVLCINPSITYGLYERLKQVLYNNKEFLGPLELFSLGMIAKLMATLATQPLIVSKAMVQKKLQKQSDEVRFDGFTHALAHLWRTEKLRGLYKGVAPQLVKGVIVQGLLFMFKDQLDMLFMILLKMIKRR